MIELYFAVNYPCSVFGDSVYGWFRMTITFVHHGISTFQVEQHDGSFRIHKQ